MAVTSLFGSHVESSWNNKSILNPSKLMMWIYTQTKSFFKPSFPKWLTGIWVICKTYVHLTNSHLPGLVDVSFSDGWISPQSSSIFVQVDVSKSALALHPCLGAKKITYRNENWSPRHDHFTLVVQLTSATHTKAASFNDVDRSGVLWLVGTDHSHWQKLHWPLNSSRVGSSLDL